MKTILIALLLTQSIPTANVDLNRTNANPFETILTPATVANGSSFHKLGFYSVDGYVFAQPLFVPGLTVGGALHDVAYLVTMNTSVYAVDANTCVQLWKVMLGTAVIVARGRELGVNPNAATISSVNTTVFGAIGGNEIQAFQLVGYWNSTAAITSIAIITGGGNFIAGSVFSLYGIS